MTKYPGRVGLAQEDVFSRKRMTEKRSKIQTLSWVKRVRHLFDILFSFYTSCWIVCFPLILFLYKNDYNTKIIFLVILFCVFAVLLFILLVLDIYFYSILDAYVRKFISVRKKGEFKKYAPNDLVSLIEQMEEELVSSYPLLFKRVEVWCRINSEEADSLYNRLR